MTPRQMNTLCRVERQEEDFGLGLPRKWQDTGKKVWVSKRTLSGTELVVANQLESRATHVLETHWTPGIGTGDRLVGESHGEKYNIVAAENVKGANRELRLTCIEVVEP